MIRFLRLFGLFRGLEQNLAEAQSYRIRAEDESRLWHSRCDWAESGLSNAQLELANTLKQISNWQAMVTGAPVPFPEISNPTPMPQEQGPERVHKERSMRALQQEAVNKSRQVAYQRRQANVFDYPEK